MFPPTLPTEILELICEHLVSLQEHEPRAWPEPLDNTSLANFRLVSHQFAQIATRWMFRALNVEISESGVDHLEQIVFRYAKHVRCVCIGASDDFLQFRTEKIFNLGDRLRACLGSLSKLHSLSFSMHRPSDEATVYQAMGSEMKCLAILRGILFLTDISTVSALTIRLPTRQTAQYFMDTLIGKDYKDEWMSVLDRLGTLAIWFDEDKDRQHFHGPAFSPNELRLFLQGAERLQHLSFRDASVFKVDGTPFFYDTLPRLSRLELTDSDVWTHGMGAFIDTHLQTLERIELARLNAYEPDPGPNSVRACHWAYDIFLRLRHSKSLSSITIVGLGYIRIQPDGSQTLPPNLDPKEFGPFSCFNSPHYMDDVWALSDVLISVRDTRRRIGLPPVQWVDDYARRFGSWDEYCKTSSII